MKLPIEDDFNDIVSKAQKGLEISTEVLAAQAELSPSQIRDLRKGEFDKGALRKLGHVLGLNVEALISIAEGTRYPKTVGSIDGFEMFSTPFAGLHVNSYLFWDTDTLEAIAFDTGTDESSLIESVRSKGLTLKTLYLTHGHRDHIMKVREIVAAFGCEVVIHEMEGDAVLSAKKVGSGYHSEYGVLKVQTMETPGHTSGGTTFIVSGLERTIAVVGDAIFVGSMGGANTSYSDGLNGVNRILSLVGDTVLASGHGPLTTVSEEREMNCFFGQSEG